MISLYNFTLPKLEAHLIERGEKKYRATQLFKWIYEKRVDNFDDMSDVSKKFRDVLNAEYEIKKPSIFLKQQSKDGTIKLLVELEDGNKVETVLMRYNYGNVACVTSQVGCNMGCSFCASGLLKKKRSLEVKELVGQILVLDDLLKAEGNGERITHVVVMGTGEPFDNYDAVMNFLLTANHDRGLAIGSRHITISTSGIVPKIKQFADGHYQYNLAVSLHAPNDELRTKLMPVNKAYPLAELMDAVEYYTKENNRRLTFEYILIKGVNDSLEHAKQLANLLRPYICYVNLIPYNSVDENGYQSTTRQEAMKFYDALKKQGIAVTIRKEHGSDIDAACGQLRIKELRKEKRLKEEHQ